MNLAELARQWELGNKAHAFDAYLALSAEDKERFRYDHPTVTAGIGRYASQLRYSVEEVDAMPTLREGHMEDLKLDFPEWRLWRSRMTVEDGCTYAIVEERRSDDGSGWEVCAEYGEPDAATDDDDEG